MAVSITNENYSRGTVVDGGAQSEKPREHVRGQQSGNRQQRTVAT